MKKWCAVFVLSSLMVVCVSSGLYGGAEEWDFSGVTQIRVKGISGDVILRPADGPTGRVELLKNVRPSDSFRPEVEQDGETLYIREKWYGNTSRGDVEWTIFLPGDSEMVSVRIKNASGNLDCRDVAVHIDYETASGEIFLSETKLGSGSDFHTASGDYIIEHMAVTEDVEFHTASGDFGLEQLTIGEGCQFSTASGTVTCQYCQCMDDVEMSSASGDVIIRDTELLGWSQFSSASGDVSIHLPKLPEHDLTAGSASGRVVLQVDDFGDDFTLILIKRKGEGRLSCPFQYTDEETFEDYHVYERKIVKRGTGRPEIELRTATGRITVKD